MNCTDQLNTIVLMRGDQLFFRSDASIRILTSLGGGWKLMNLLFVFPGFLRDVVYNFVAKHRFRIFGKLQACRVPSPAERDRFLD